VANEKNSVGTGVGMPLSNSMLKESLSSKATPRSEYNKAKKKKFDFEGMG